MGCRPPGNPRSARAARPCPRSLGRSTVKRQPARVTRGSDRRHRHALLTAASRRADHAQETSDLVRPQHRRLSKWTRRHADSGSVFKKNGLTKQRGQVERRPRGQRGENVVWRAIAGAPEGYCHPKASVIGLCSTTSPLGCRSPRSRHASTPTWGRFAIRGRKRPRRPATSRRPKPWSRSSALRLPWNAGFARRSTDLPSHECISS
jgi:hypothetical protein